MIVTFDSNTWRKIATPNNFPKDPLISKYRYIADKIKDGTIKPFISETIFTLEGVKRGDRKNIFKNYKAIYNRKAVINSDGSMLCTFTYGPDENIHPGNNEFLKEHLHDAISMGFKILRFPRIAGIVNGDIEPYLYEFDSVEGANYYSRLFEIAQYIRSLKAGEYNINKIGEKYNPNGWFIGVGMAPDSEDLIIASAVAEWSDGDSVASHIALGGDYFCTNDKAKGAGANSILSSNNVAKLKEKYGFKSVTPDELVEIIINDNSNR